MTKLPPKSKAPTEGSLSDSHAEAFFAAPVAGVGHGGHGGSPGGYDHPGHEELAPRQRVARYVNLFGIMLGLMLGWLFHREFLYYVSDPTPIALGDTGDEGFFQRELPHNRFVQVSGLPDPRKATATSLGQDYRYFVLMGSWILVQEKLDEKTPLDPHRDYERFTGEGRLIQIEQDGRYTQIKTFMAGALGYKLKDRTFLLMQGERPREGWFAPAVFVLSILLFAVNAVGLARRLKA